MPLAAKMVNHVWCVALCLDWVDNRSKLKFQAFKARSTKNF